MAFRVQKPSNVFCDTYQRSSKTRWLKELEKQQRQEILKKQKNQTIELSPLSNARPMRSERVLFFFHSSSRKLSLREGTVLMLVNVKPHFQFGICSKCKRNFRLPLLKPSPNKEGLLFGSLQTEEKNGGFMHAIPTLKRTRTKTSYCHIRHT
jgi:hypothetical protein